MNERKTGLRQSVPIDTISVESVRESLLTTSPENIDAWLSGILHGDKSNLPWIFSRAEDLDVIDCIIPRYTSTDEHDLEVREIFIQSFARLVNNIDFDSLDSQDAIYYADSAIYCAGRFRALDCKDKIAELAYSERAKKIVSGNKTLHTRLLQALASFGCDIKTKTIFERDINDINFAMISFIALSGYDQKNFEKYKPILETLLSKDHKILLDFILTTYAPQK